MSLLAACEQSEMPVSESSGDYIGFAAPSLRVEEVSTRSTFNEAFPANGIFGVLGYCVPYQRGTTTPDFASGTALWGVKLNGNHIHPDVFYKQEITFDGNYCQYTPLKKWYNPEDNPEIASEDVANNFLYTFFAYYPANAFTVNAPADANTIGAPKLTFTMPFSTNNEGINQQLDDTQTPDAMVAVQYNHPKRNGNVNFNFAHLMVGLGFAVNNYNETLPVTVHSVSLSGSFTKSITIDFSDNNNVDYSFADTYQGTYRLLTEERTVESGSSLNPVGDRHLLLLSDSKRGTYFGSDVTVTIDYTFNGHRKTETRERPSTFMPQPGTKYTAALNFIGDTFVLHFIPDNGDFWEDGGDSDITIQ